MTQSKIYQIYYSKETQASNDQGFLQLDNLSNERADWSEYWPIRNFLLSNELDESSFYGFFSPKFKQKTFLSSTEVYHFIDQNDEAEVILFPPHYDHSAFNINIFLQAEAAHRGILEVFCRSFHREEDFFKNLVMTSNDTIFCNYFVAKPSFWRQWLKIGEGIFSEAEQLSSELAILLNGDSQYGIGRAPSKVFVIERIASYLLVTQKHQVAVFDPSKTFYDFCPPAFSLVLDALKIAYVSTGRDEFLNHFHVFRDSLLQSNKTQVAQ
ncbi:MAG: hypothetical protein WCK52_09920 [Betaproteobacteria bacterium]